MISIAIFSTVLCGCYFFIRILWYCFKKLNSSHDIHYLPGDIPIFGHTLMLRDRKYYNNNKEKWFDENNGVFGLYFMFHRVVFTRNVAIWEDLLSSQKYTGKGIGYSLIEKFLGNGLLTSENGLWRTRRKMITPAFHFDILGDFISVMENRTMELIQFLNKYAEDESSSFDAFKVTKPFSMSVICETSMGMNLSLEETNNGKFSKLYEGIVMLLFRRHLRPWLKYDWAYWWTSDWNYFKAFRDSLRGFVREIVEYRIASRKRTDIFPQKRRIFIDIMLDAYEKGEIDIEGILDEVNTFVNAGYETTSTALAWCLYCLGRNQDVQKKLYKELSEFGKSNSLKMEDLKELRYLDLVIKETLRLHPVVSRFSRAIAKGTILGGIEFPECSLGVDITAMNRCPDVWENPMAFIPERFETFEEKKRSAFVYIPFSAGPRNCIGQRFAMFELKVALYHLIRRYQVTSLQKESELKETFDITHGCEDGLILSLKNR